MKNKRTFLVVSSLLALFAFSGCGTSALAKKNEERITAQRYKVNQLRAEDVQILGQIDGLLDQCESLISDADKVRNDNEDRAALTLDAAEAVLVEANTKRLYAANRASYEAARRAYLQRAGRIQTLRKVLETQIPAITEANQ